MLYSPTQEVPATPVLMRPRPVWSHGFGTPVATNLNDFAVVPDDSAVVPDFLEHTQDLSGVVPRTPVISDRHLELQPSGSSRSTRLDNLRNTSTQSNTPRLLLNSPAGVRSGQAEQIVPGTPVGGFFRCLNTPKSDWSTPDAAAVGSNLVMTPTSRPYNNRRKYIRTSKLCFGPSTSMALPKGDQMDDNSDKAKKVDHVVDATGDNRRMSKTYDSSAMESSNASKNASTSPEGRNETLSLSDPTPVMLQESGDIKDFLDMI